VGLEQQAPRFRLEGAVINAGRSHRVGVALKSLAAIAVCIVSDDQVPRYEEYLFPILVDERRSRINTGIEPQQARPISAPLRLVQASSDDFLLDAPRIAWRGLPPLTEVELEEFLMQLGIGHTVTLGSETPPEGEIGICSAAELDLRETR
jgi:hypothetical protein